MNKILTVALGAALVAASASASAADANGSFFINAGVGQAQYHVGHTDGLGYKLDDKDTAGAVRFGYAWKVGSGFDLGVAAGEPHRRQRGAQYKCV
jgi:opacity protein-like surface antigen